MQNFDIVKLEKIVDWFNVMTYDLHGTWDSTDKFIGPIVNAHTNLTEIDQTMDLFWRNKIDPVKIVMGLGFYGRSFTLSDPSCTTAGCGFSGGGNPGPCSASAGTLMFAEIQDIIAGGAVVTLDKAAAVKTVVWNSNQWVSYDDAETFKMKIDYANNLGLGGTMVWASSTDDGSYTAAQALSQNTGLSKKSLFGGGGNPKPDPITACTWGECGKDCPAGSSAAQRSDGKNKGNAGIYAFCPEGQSRNYCCPSNDVPTCQWRGRAPFCHGECEDGEIEVASDTSATGSSCWTGHKVLCCQKKASDAAIGQCKWEGASPFCAANPFKSYGCDESDRQELTYDAFGAGGEQLCLTGYKSLCCTQPPPFDRCDWTGKHLTLKVQLQCQTGCASGKQTVATDPSWCDTGSNYFCCDQPPGSIPDAPTNLDFCVAPNDAYVLSDANDLDGNPADLLELYWYEDDCFAVPNTADPSVHKRWTDMIARFADTRLVKRWDPMTRTDPSLPSVCLNEANCWSIPDTQDSGFQQLLAEVQEFRNHTEAVLVPRARTPKFCLPNGKKNSFTAKNYPSVSTLSGSRQFFRVVKTGVKAGVCASLPLVLGARAVGDDYVVEHVTELQTPAQYANAMLKNILSSGAKPSASGYNWVDVFGPNGYFYQTWQQLGVSAPANFPGDTPEDLVYKALGSSSDTANLQILDASTNSVKAAVRRPPLMFLTARGT